MAATSDWSQLEGTVTGSGAPDLFGGELFSEELIDIYNADAMVGANGDVSSEIPTLPDQPSNKATGSAAEAVDDGLGAFRPCTSFNDLASLLPPADGTQTPATDGSVPPMTTVTAPTAPTKVPQKKETKKRAAPAPRAEVPVKKRATVPKLTATTRRVPAMPKGKRAVNLPVGSGIKVGPQSAGQAALKLQKQRVLHDPSLKVVGSKVVTTTTKAAASKLTVVKPVVVTSNSTTVVTPVVSGVKPDTKTTVASVPSVSATNDGATTEADFKSVAQAAVTNLIMNASSQTKPESADSSKKVDTSSAHIKALTSTNWVAACSGPGGSMAANAAAQAAAEAKANRARRQNLTPDERARQNRDRNREHARNTRLRKKAYVEELKRTLTELVAQRDASEVEKRHSAQRELEQREVRFRVMEEFLKLRGRNETNFSRWSAILADGFALSLPMTPFRKMAEPTNPSGRPSGKRPIEQVLRGASEVMTDSSCVASFLSTLGDQNSPPSSSVTTLLYYCDRKNFFMDGCTGVLTWTANSVGAVNKGSPYELTIKGTMRSKFSPASNKLVSGELMFDVGIIGEQLTELVIPQANAADQMVADPCDAGVDEAAEAAASEADALLNSLQMPQLGVSVPSAITVVPQTSTDNLVAHISVGGSDKEESISSDESLGETLANKGAGEGGAAVGPRRSSRHSSGTNA